MSHDTIFPSREDGTVKVMMSKQLIFNASLSRDDALAYRTNNTLPAYGVIDTAYPRKYFKNKRKSKAAQMYDGGGAFYTIIEAIRHNTANGMVHGEVIDSVASYSEKVFLEELLKYCQKAGIEVISKAKAYDICFNHVQKNGNLIYNRAFRNTAKEFFDDAEKIPENPDGYIGLCKVAYTDGKPQLLTQGETTYIHYGIPIGTIQYSANISGTGCIAIYAIKNNSPATLHNDELELLRPITIDSREEEKYSVDFYIADNPRTDYEQICEGLGEKLMGIKIVYSPDLCVSDINLNVLD